MSQSLEQLRMAAALAHGVHGAELRLHRRNGTPLVVARHASADIDPCQLRQIVAAHRCPMQQAAVSRVSRVEVGGSLVSREGDLFTSVESRGRAHWFVTFLGEEHVGAVLDDVARSVGAGSSMAAFLKVDPALGVTVVSLVADCEGDAASLARIADLCYRTCVVDELVHGADPAARVGGIISTMRSGEGQV